MFLLKRPLQAAVTLTVDVGDVLYLIDLIHYPS